MSRTAKQDSLASEKKLASSTGYKEQGVVGCSTNETTMSESQYLSVFLPSLYWTVRVAQRKFGCCNRRRQRDKRTFDRTFLRT